jgi:hypothetical protein
MATSGNTIWNNSVTRATIIKSALRKLAVLPSGGSPSTNQTSDANDALNNLIKAFQADGMPVWKITTKTFTTLSGTSTYTIGPQVTPSTTQFVGPQPLKIIEAFYTPSGGNNTPLNIYNRYDFMQLPNTSTGVPVNLYAQPGGYSNNTTIQLWPTPSDSTTTITVHYQSPFEDMSNDTDNLDFPAYWITALVFNLAWVLSPEYGIPPVDRDKLGTEARYWHEQALSYGSEEGGLFFQPRSE